MVRQEVLLDQVVAVRCRVEGRPEISIGSPERLSLGKPGAGMRGGGFDMNDSPFDDLKKEMLAGIWIEECISKLNNTNTAGGLRTAFSSRCCEFGKGRV